MRKQQETLVKKQEEIRMQQQTQIDYLRQEYSFKTQQQQFVGPVPIQPSRTQPQVSGSASGVASIFYKSALQRFD